MANQKNERQAQKIILIFSIIVNVISLFIFFTYLFTPELDWIVIKQSGPRMCNDKYYSYGIKINQDGKDFCGLMDKIRADR